MVEAARERGELFGSVLRSEAQGSGPGRLATAAFLAVGLHALALGALWVSTSGQAGQAGSEGRGGDSVEVAVRFMSPRAAVALPSAAREQPVSRSAPVRRRVPRPAPVLSAPQPVAERPVAPSAPVEEGGTEAARAEAASGGEVGSGGSGVIGGLPGAGFGGEGGLVPPPPLPPPAPVLSREQRQSLTSRYLQELFRSRLAARFQYPEEAEQLGLEGLVTLRVSIDRSGQLLGARVQGRCPHPMLCDAALRTVRESVPFPPPPAELGGSIAVDVPFQYRLE